MSEGELVKIDAELNIPVRRVAERKRVDLLRKKVNAIAEKAEDLRATKINPYWIFKNCGKEYYFIKARVRTLDGGINWRVVTNLLPEKWKNRWSYEKKRKWDEKRAKRKLVDLLEKENPKTFNPHWIKKKDYGLYRYLQRRFKNSETGTIEWPLFVRQLPEEWLERWTRGAREEVMKELKEKKRKFNFSSAIERLNYLLEKEKPNSFSSTYIDRLDPHLHSYFRRYVSREGGGLIGKELYLK